MKDDDESIYITPRKLAKRWECSRSSVDRIARRNHFTRVMLGEGKNGMVRYLRKEVEAYEGIMPGRDGLSKKSERAVSRPGDASPPGRFLMQIGRSVYRMPRSVCPEPHPAGNISPDAPLALETTARERGPVVAAG